MNIKLAQVIGLNTDQKAAQVISSSREGESFFAVLDLTCDDAFTKGRQILSDLLDFYFDSEAPAAGEKLTATFAKAKEAFGSDEHSLLLVSVSGKVLYLINEGAMEVSLKRDGKLSSLLSVGESSQLISGFLQPGDQLLLSTKSLVEFLGEDLDSLLKLPLDTFEGEVTDRIGSSDLENKGLAGLAIMVEAEPEGVSPEPAPVKMETDGPKESASSIAESLMEPERSIPALDQQSYGSVENSDRKSGLVKKVFRIFPKSGRSRLIIAVILIVIIAVGVGLKIKAGKDAATNAAFTLQFNQAKDDFNAAKSLSSLDPVAAKAKLDSAKSEVAKALALKPKDAGALDLQKQINSGSDLILQQSSASQFPVFLDLDLIKKGFQATQLSLSGNNLLLLDPSSKTLVEIDLTKKSNQILAGSSQLGEATLASINGDLAFVFSKDKGVLKVDTKSQKVTSVAKTDKDWGQIADLAGFGSNIYLLDSAGNQIWKYLPTDSGYSDKRPYLSSGVKAAFGSSVRLQIESSVYVLTQDGQITRFTRGDKDNFSYAGLDKGVKNPKSFFTSSDTDNLYLLDSGNARLLVLTKTGQYKSQITGDKFGTATDLVVDEKGKKVYLLEGSKIYSVDLK